MKDMFLLKDYQEAAESLRSRVTHFPKIAIILGSGLGNLADRIETEVVLG